MAKLHFDPWLLETEVALWSLGEYLGVMEEQISFVDAQRRVRLKADLAAAHTDWDEAQMHLQELDLLVEHAFPRAFRGGFVVILWGTFEAGVAEIARGLAAHRELRLKLRDLRGDDFIDLTSKYFEAILHLTLFEEPRDVAAISDLLKVRNGFAHGNGRLAALNEQTSWAVDSVVRKNVGVSVDWGNIVLGAAFCETSFVAVDRCLRSIVNRARKARRISSTDPASPQA